MTHQFKNDLQRVYELLGERQRELGTYFSIVEAREYDSKKEAFIDAFLETIELSICKENRVALLSRLIHLRDEQMVQALEKEGKDSIFITQAKEKAYLWVRDFHLERHEELLEIVEKELLLTPFYRTLLKGVHHVGVAMSRWQSSWTEHIINTINPLLELEFDRDEEAIARMLKEKGLYDKDTKGCDGDRSYSVLFKIPGGYEAKAYAVAFANEVKDVREALSLLCQTLAALEDTELNQKEVYVAYFKALDVAFAQEDRDELIACWAEVDRKWMDITSPIQIGHPLEYYEDHYKKAVALEWDVRISNPQNVEALQTYENIKNAFEILFDDSGSQALHVKKNVLYNLKRVQLYIGRPALFYAAEFNGLFSAQVVPNDEIVSAQKGKKIFAFADNILDTARSKPFLKIHQDIFGEAFMNKERSLIFHNAQVWHQVYDISTIGHEFGHILWMDHDTELQMNQSGVFKNIEEFKATAGGLMAFFMNENPLLGENLLSDTIKRSVGLIGWMKTGEVEPYYCEGLIHLTGLFESGVLRYDGKLHINSSKDAYEALKKWYEKTYKALAKHYLEKKDAKLFLSQFALKDTGVYLPVSLEVRAFVMYYWELHQRMGREIDENVKREMWI